MKKERKNLKAWLSYLMIIIVFIISIIFIYICYKQSNIEVGENSNNQPKNEVSNIKKNNNEDELVVCQSIKSVKSKKISIYFFNKDKPITNSSIIISYKNLNKSYLDVCFYGVCEIYTFVFPINIIETKEKNIMTDCAWKNQFEKHLQGRPFKIEYYNEYRKIIKNLANDAIKKTEFNPCTDNRDCPSIQDGGDYSLDVTDDSFRPIDLKKYPELKARPEVNNSCYENDVFENWSREEPYYE